MRSDRGILARRGVAAALFAAIALLSGSCTLLGESPEPKDVTLVFEGLGSVDRSDAVRRIGYVFEDFAKAARAEPILDDASFELELLFQEQGYRTARVEAALEPAEKGRPTARFTIQPGVRTRLAGIATPGVPAQDASAVAAILSPPGGGGWYSARAVNVGVVTLIEWYRERGHMDVVVGDPSTTFSDDGSEARVEIAVTPGPAYRLERVDVDIEADGGDWPVEVPRPAVDKALSDLVRGPYSDPAMRIARGRIAGVFGEHGHPDAVVTLSERAIAGSAVVLAFRVRPGPRVRVGTVRFEGQDTTSESFLEKRVELEQGAWYQRSLLRQSIANLSRSGLFDRVAIDLAPAAEGAAADGVETRDVVVSVEEAAAREYHIEPGYGSYEGLRLGLGVRQKNLFGSGRILDLSGTVAELAQRVDLSLIDPWILGPDATAVATVFWNRRQEPSFLRLEQGVQLSGVWRLGAQWDVRGTWQYRRSDTSDVEVDAPQLVEDVGVSELSFEPTWDTRDAFENPHTGQQSRGGVDLSLAAIGSELEYVRLKLEHARYLPLGAKTTLALSARVGWIAPIGSTDEIPIQERFFNGGENSVRSFLESELGPVDANGKPIGGEASTTATVEVRQALARRFQLAAFVDAGTVELQHTDVFRFTDPGFGIGLGLRYLLPIGPIRVDGAVNPDPGPGEANSALHLSVGFSF